MSASVRAARAWLRGCPLSSTLNPMSTKTTASCCLLLLTPVLAGCGKSDPVSPGPLTVGTSLPVTKPASGGVLISIPAGKFTMGQAGDRADEAPHEVTV